MKAVLNWRVQVFPNCNKAIIRFLKFSSNYYYHYPRLKIDLFIMFMACLKSIIHTKKNNKPLGYNDH